jgi:hypothetical protein
MHRQYIFKICAVLGLVLLFSSCATTDTKPSAENFQPPQLALDSFQVTQYDGYWYYSKDVPPTKGEAGDHGAPLPMSFVFAVNNANPYPVKLDGFRFTVSFEGFDLITVNNDNMYWIPAETRDYVSAQTMITTRSALLSLLVTGGFQLKEKGWSPWDALKRWWNKVPTLEVPVTVKDGSATFTADGVSQVIPFEFVYPQGEQ